MTTVKFTHDRNLEGVYPPPVPAIGMAPQFYRAIKPLASEDPPTGTVKRCVPFLDALSAGFIIPLWADLYVRTSGGAVRMAFPAGLAQPESLGIHGHEQIPGHPLADRPYSRDVLKFNSPWVIETEPGVSCLFTSPFNHFEQRFKIIDGIVDTDTYYNNVNLPFLWTGGDADYIIPKGTPLVQVIPFRRESYELEVGVTDEDRRHRTAATLGTRMQHGYRSEFWSKRKTTEDK
jgi:hypothetical protein